MGSFAEERFRFLARVARVFGCFFVSRSWNGGFEDYEADFSIGYAAYITGATVVIITFEFIVVMHRFLSQMSNVVSFFDSLYYLLHLIVAVIVIVNFFVLNLNTPTIVAALKAVKRLETSIDFRLQDEKRFWFKQRIRVVVLILASVGLSLCRGFDVREGTEDLPDTMASLFIVLSALCTLIYGVINALVLLLEKYFCVVLSHYVRFQAETAKQVLLRSDMSATPSDVTRLVLKLRSTIAAVTKIVWQVDKCLRLAVVVNFGCSAIALCIVVYAVFAAETSWGKLFLTAVYAAFTCMPIVDVSFSASEIRSEAANLKALLESSSLLALPSRVCRQMELFALTIDEDQLCFTGSGFFTVDKSVLTSFVAVVMTYSLLLVQTGRKPEAPHCGRGS